jgi:hypothetical protein
MKRSEPIETPAPHDCRHSANRGLAALSQWRLEVERTRYEAERAESPLPTPSNRAGPDRGRHTDSNEVELVPQQSV